MCAERINLEAERIASEKRRYLTEAYGSRYAEAVLSNIVMSEKGFKDIHKWIAEKSGILVFLGNPGIGKTYFCAAMHSYCWKMFSSIRYWKEGALLSKLRNSMEGSIDYWEVLRMSTDDDLLIFDDMGSTGIKEGWRKEILFELLDYRYNSRKPTIFTSNLSQKEIEENFDPRFSSRLFASENYLIQLETKDMRKEGK